MSMSCGFCRHPNPDGAKFCNACGAQLTLKPCPECEAVNAAAAVRCYQCEHSFDEVAAAAPGLSSTVVANHALSFRDDSAHIPETLAYALVADQPARNEFADRGGAAAATTDDNSPSDRRTNRQDASPYPETDENAARDRQTNGEEPPDDGTNAASPDDALPLHEDIRSFRDSLRQQQARRSYRAAGAALVVIAIVAAGYGYWSIRGNDGSSRTEAAVKERSNAAASPEKAAGTTPATAMPSAGKATPSERAADVPVTSSSEISAGQASGSAVIPGQASRTAADAAASAAESGSARPTTRSSVATSSKRGNSDAAPRRRASSGAVNDPGADAAATQRLIARDLGRFQSSDSTSKPTLDRDAIETQRLVDRDLAPFRERNSHPPDRAFPDIN